MFSKKIASFLLLLSLFSFCFSNGIAFDKISFSPDGNMFDLNPVTDTVLIGSGCSLVVFDMLIEKYAGVKPTQYNGESFYKEDVNSVDRLFMKPYSKTLDNVGSILAFSSMLMPLTLLSTDESEWIPCFTMYAESLLFSYGMKELCKNFVFRPRPYMYYDGYPQKKAENGDWNCSFCSGHTTLAFTSAAFTSYVFCKCNPDSKWKVPVVVSSYGLALGTALCRMESGNHFFTDVLTGALIGSVSGILIPMIHPFSEKSNMDIAVTPLSISFSFSF